MLLSAEFTDPRLVAVYDAVNSYDPNTQPDFYIGLAHELGAKSVLDIGCGTGLITHELIRQSFTVTGVEPSPAMIAVARSHPHAEHARWIHGDASSLPEGEGDLAFMSGHVAQFFLTDQSWRDALSAMHTALRPGGCLSFESRNPLARGWESWSAENRQTTFDTNAGTIETWSEVEDVNDGFVSCVIHYHFLDRHQELVAHTTLRFRTIEELEQSLREAGFMVEQAYGDWDRRPLDERSSREIILVARRT